MISESQQGRRDPINLDRSDQPRIDRVAAVWNDTICLLGRILIGGIFVQSGFQKLMGLDAFAASLARNGIPAAIAPVLAPIGAGVEFVGGLAVVFGLMTRYAAVLMIVFVIVATLISHRFWALEGAERRAPGPDRPVRQECGDHRRLLVRLRHRRWSLEPGSLAAPCRVDHARCATRSCRRAA